MVLVEGGLEFLPFGMDTVKPSVFWWDFTPVLACFGGEDDVWLVCGDLVVPVSDGGMEAGPGTPIVLG